MGRVAVFFADGFEEIEALTVVDLLRRAGIETSMVSVTGRAEVTSSHSVTVAADEQMDDVDFDRVDMIVLPGGMPGTTNLEKCEPLMEQVRAFNEAGRPIAAICAAPGILGAQGMLRGRRACSHPSAEARLEGAEVTEKPVEISDHLIMARGMGCAIPFGLAIVEHYLGRGAVEELKQKIVFG